MGKQKQQRRSAKKKGGKKGEAGGAGQNNNCDGDESVKCTACAQLVKKEDTIHALFLNAIAYFAPSGVRLLAWFNVPIPCVHPRTAAVPALRARRSHFL